MYSKLLLTLICFLTIGCYTIVYPPPEELANIGDSVIVSGDSTSGDGINITVINENQVIFDQYYQDPRYRRYNRWNNDYYWDPYYYDYYSYNHHPRWYSGRYYSPKETPKPKTPRRKQHYRRPTPPEDVYSTPSPVENVAPSDDSDVSRRAEAVESGQPNSEAAVEPESKSDPAKAERVDTPQKQTQPRSERSARSIRSDPRHTKNDEPDARQNSSEPPERKIDQVEERKSENDDNSKKQRKTARRKPTSEKE